MVEDRFSVQLKPKLNNYYVFIVDYLLDPFDFIKISSFLQSDKI